MGINVSRTSAGMCHRCFIEPAELRYATLRYNAMLHYATALQTLQRMHALDVSPANTAAHAGGSGGLSWNKWSCC